ncbi:MAG: carboxypeptidase-like regulatory domain-containing protein [Bacteroidales bacterium]|nr:carboxypeptidase-like regulatory domain-containing protein [Candidatus Sodaliphilus aphodohippi]
MKMVIRTFSLLLLVMCSLSLNAGVIKGVVTDSLNHPLPFATVWVDNHHTTTGIEGTFTLRNIEAGDRLLCVTYLGYRKKTDTIAVNNDTPAQCAIVMDEARQVLPDLFVTPTGETIKQFLCRMVAENRKKLKDVVAHYDAKGTLHYEIDKDSAFSSIPKSMAGPFKFFLSMLGYGKVYNLNHDYPGLIVELDQPINADKGNIKGGERTLAYVNKEIGKDENDALMKLSGGLTENFYERIYRHFSTKKVKKMRQSEEKAEERGEDIDADDSRLQYVGLYEEDGREIYVLKSNSAEVHIVDQCWQIKCIKTTGKNGSSVCQCRELLPGVFLPVSFYSAVNLNFDDKGIFTKELEEKRATDRSKMKPGDIAKLEREIAELERFARHPVWELERTYTWDYTNIIPAK